MGKQLYLQSKNIEAYQELGKVIELSLPIQDFWKVETLIKEANFLKASGEPTPEVMDFYRKIFEFCTRFAVYEAERLWLYEQAKEKS